MMVRVQVRLRGMGVGAPPEGSCKCDSTRDMELKDYGFCSDRGGG